MDGGISTVMCRSAAANPVKDGSFPRTTRMQMIIILIECGVKSVM